MLRFVDVTQIVYEKFVLDSECSEKKDVAITKMSFSRKEIFADGKNARIFRLTVLDLNLFFFFSER